MSVSFSDPLAIIAFFVGLGFFVKIVVETVLEAMENRERKDKK